MLGEGIPPRDGSRGNSWDWSRTRPEPNPPVRDATPRARALRARHAPRSSATAVYAQAPRTRQARARFSKLRTAGWVAAPEVLLDELWAVPYDTQDPRN